MYPDNRVIGVLLVCHHMIYVSLCCMPVYVYALILLLYDKFHVTLAYPCIFVLFLLCCLFCDDHLLVGAYEREARAGSEKRSGAA